VIWRGNLNLWLLLGFSRSIGTTSIKSLRDAARALDMKFIYGFVPKDESFSIKQDKAGHYRCRGIRKPVKFSLLGYKFVPAYEKGNGKGKILFDSGFLAV